MSNVLILCRICKKELPIESFIKAGFSKDGKTGRCKSCIAEYKRQHRKDNIEKIKKYLEENRDSILKKKKQHYQNTKKYNCEYSKQYRKINSKKCSEYNNQYYKENKEPILENKKKYRQNNTGFIREYNNLYYQKNSEKVIILQQRRESRKKGLLSTLTSSQWECAKKHFDNKCCYCGEEKALQQEHFVALSANGEYSNNNIIPACKSCNCSKNNKDFFKWYIKQTFYSKKREQKILNYLNYRAEVMA